MHRLRLQGDPCLLLLFRYSPSQPSYDDHHQRLDDEGVDDHNAIAHFDANGVEPVELSPEPQHHHHHHHHSQQLALQHGRQHHVDPYQQQHHPYDHSDVASDDGAAELDAQPPAKRKKSKKDKKRNRDREHRHRGRSPNSQMDGSPARLGGGEPSDEMSTGVAVGGAEDRHRGGTPQYDRDDGPPAAGRDLQRATPPGTPGTPDEAPPAAAAAEEVEDGEAADGADGEALSDAELELRRAALLAQLDEQDE